MEIVVMGGAAVQGSHAPRRHRPDDRARRHGEHCGFWARWVVARDHVAGAGC